MEEVISSNEENALTELQSAQSTEIKPYYNDILVFDEIPEYDTQDYDVFNEKDFKKYISDIENICRTSFEYRQFVNYLREYMDMNKCSFFQNVTNSDTFKIKIHLHHSPFTLYDIVMTIFNKRMFYHESLEVEMVAKEVMYIHYFLMVGIIPLAETVHDLVHKQIIFIPVDNVMGNYSEFIETYREFIPEDAMDRFNAAVEHTKYYNEAQEMKILQINPIVIQLPGDDGTGLYNLPKMENIITAMNNRIQEIKDNRYQIPTKQDENIIDESIKPSRQTELERAFKYV